MKKKYPYPHIIRYINYSFRIFIVILFFIAVSNILTNNITAGGDSVNMPVFVIKGKTFTLWLTGTFVANVSYSIVKCPVFHKLIPEKKKEFLEFMVKFTVFLGSLIIAITSLWILFRWKERAAVLVPMLTPIWIIFSTGYAEYYPYVAGLYLIYLGLLTCENMKDFTPTSISFFCVLFALSYVAFIPLAIYFLIYYIIVNPKQWLKTLGMSIFFTFVMISVMWPGTVYGYINELWRNMQFHQGTIFMRFSFNHLTRLVKNISWGVGYTIPIIGLIGVFFVKFKFNKKILFLAPVVIWQILYSLFFNPLLGVEKDRDLYFMGYITLSFLIGLVIDNINWSRFKKKEVKVS